MALTHWASEGDANTHLDKGQWTGGKKEGRRGESATVMMCCEVAGKRRGERHGRGRKERR